MLAKPPKQERNAPVAPSIDVSGQWDVDVEYILGKARHGLVLEQKGAELAGTHAGEFLGSDLRGTVDGNELSFRSSHKIEGTRIGYDFNAKASGDTMEGTIDLGEYGQARFTAKRHIYGQPGGIVRPIKNT